MNQGKKVENVTQSWHDGDICATHAGIVMETDVGVIRATNTTDLLYSMWLGYVSLE